MLYGIDTSNWQGSYNVSETDAGFVIAKATEGAYYTDPFCDATVQQCIAAGIPWGFYHFASTKSGMEEASYFLRECANYFGHGIPVLDWEGDQDYCFVNAFVGTVHAETGVWPWIYANPWRFNQNAGLIEPNCARWVASYPDVAHPTWGQAEGWECPEADGNVVAWQFASDGLVSGISGNVDMDLYYGDTDSWRAYARGDWAQADDGSDGGDAETESAGDETQTLENDDYRITIERKA